MAGDKPAPRSAMILSSDKICRAAAYLNKALETTAGTALFAMIRCHATLFAFSMSVGVHRRRLDSVDGAALRAGWTREGLRWRIWITCQSSGGYTPRVEWR